MKKINQQGISHYLLPLLIVVVIGLIGVRVLTASHADSPQSVTFATKTASSAATIKNEAIYNYTDASAPVTNSPSSVPYASIGSQTVSWVAGGQTLTYVVGSKNVPTSTCFDVYVTQPKTGTVTIPVQFITNNNSVTVNLSSTASTNLQQVCVPAGKAVNTGLTIKNLSNTQTVADNLEVYDAVSTW